MHYGLIKHNSEAKQDELLISNQTLETTQTSYLKKRKMKTFVLETETLSLNSYTARLL